MFNIIMVSTLGSPWVQQQELVPGDPATGPPYYSGGTETGDQRTKALTKSLASALSRDRNAPLLRAQKHTLTLARPVKRNFGLMTTFHILFVLAFGENASFDLILFPILAIWQF